MVKLVSVKDLCDQLKVARSTIYGWRKEDRIKEHIVKGKTWKWLISSQKTVQEQII